MAVGYAQRLAKNTKKEEKGDTMQTHNSKVIQQARK